MLGARFDAALGYAVELHRSQVRKATSIPYVSHLFAVRSLVLEDGGTEDEAIAALLHDGPEDQGGEVVLDAIKARFGVEVAAMVAVLSGACPPRETCPTFARPSASSSRHCEAGVSSSRAVLARPLRR